MNRTVHSSIQDMLVTFFVSFASLVFEVFLSRLFSVILDYNFVFLVVSLATLGIGLGGYAAYRWFEHFMKLKGTILGLFSLSMIGIVFIIYMLPFLGAMAYSSLALIPFLLSGYILAGILQTQHKHIPKIYFADLLGAGIGAAGAILLMNAMNPVQTMGLLSLLVFVIFLIIHYGNMRNRERVLHGVLLIALIYNLIDPVLNHMEFKSYRTSPYTAFYQQKDSKMIYSEWNAFSRTDVYDAGDELLYMTIDGSAVSPISKYSGDLNEVDYLMTTTGSLAFQSKPKGNALIIGAGGGQEVLTAQMAGFKQTEAVDINKGSFDAVHALSGMSGDLYHQQGVKAIVSDGRNYIRSTKNKYDLIYLSLVMKQSENGPGLALTENYIFTREAIQEYMNKLTDSGRLAFLLHDDMELNKILFAARKYFREQGVPDEEVKNRLAVVGTYQHLGHVIMGMGDSKITRPLIMMTKQPFRKPAATTLLNSAQQIQQIPVHIPYVFDRYSALNEMLAKQKVNLKANRDDMPFFYHKTEGIPYTLTLSLLITMIIALFILSRNVFFSGQAVYFSGVAVGFMLIEITFIQKFILFLGHPTLSFVLVLGVLLTAGGLGSFFSKRWVLNRRRYVPLLFVGILAVLVDTTIGWYYDHPIDLSLSLRIFLAVLFITPVGFFMGMPFPHGLSKLQKHQIAVSWGFNGIMTVAGSLLAATISLTFGFTMTIAVGATVYAMLFVLQPLLKMH